MTPVEIERIESHLAAALPAEYRGFLLSYPSDAAAEVRRYDLFDDPAAVVEETLAFRRYLADETLPNRLMVIGDGGCGDKACLDLSTGEVLFWCHAEEDLVPLAESVSEYYVTVVETV